MKYNCETFKNILNGNIYNVQWLENTLQDINFSHIEAVNEIISQLLSRGYERMINHYFINKLIKIMRRYYPTWLSI